MSPSVLKISHVFMVFFCRQSTWFIGGYYANDAVHWDTGDVITDLITPELWNVPPKLISRLYSRIAYTYGEINTMFCVFIIYNNVRNVSFYIFNSSSLLFSISIVHVINSKRCAETVVCY